MGSGPCRKNLLVWLSQSVDNLSKADVLHCWKSTDLLRAWEKPVQIEASRRVSELFGKDPIEAGIVVDVSGVEDQEAAFAGTPFVEVEEPEEPPLGLGEKLAQ